jgi:hypothetical protein
MLSDLLKIGAKWIRNVHICGTIFQENLKQTQKWIMYVHICGTIQSGQSEIIAHPGHNIVRYRYKHITCMDIDQDYVLLWHSTLMAQY